MVVSALQRTDRIIFFFLSVLPCLIIHPLRVCTHTSRGCCNHQNRQDAMSHFSSIRLPNFLCRSFRLSLFFFFCLSSYFPSWHSVGSSLSLDFGFSFSPSPHIHAWHARLSTNIQSHVLHGDDCYILRHFSLSIFCFSFLVYATATSSIKWTMSPRSWRGVPCNVSTSSPPLLAYMRSRPTQLISPSHDTLLVHNTIPVSL